MERRVDAWTVGLAVAGLALVFAAACVTVADVLLRAWGRSVLGLTDIVTLATIVGMSACFPVCLLRQGNITVRLLSAAVGPRVSAWLDAFAALLVLVVFALIAWRLGLYAAELAAREGRTFILRWPTAPFWWTSTALFAVSALTQVVVTATQFKRAASGADNGSDAGER